MATLLADGFRPCSGASYSIIAAASEVLHMTPGVKKMLFGSMAVAGVVGILAIVDLAAGFPFAGQMVFDIMFLVSAALVGYMAFEAYRELT